MKRAQYLRMFRGARQEKALSLAHEIRKFEIDLYWKRATYFWAFIAVAFAGFFVAVGQSDQANTFAIACLGFLFSLGWYLVNRGSSAWQRNWEVHVDLLEDEITGPLHKAIVQRREYKFWDLLGPYGYSPSRLNTSLSLFLVVVWVVLASRTVLRILARDSGLTSVIVFGLATVVAAAAMLGFARSSHVMTVEDVDVVVRKYP